MNSLIKPLIVASFLLMCSGLVPGVSILMSGFGLAALLLAMISGVQILGAQDRDFDQVMSMIKIQRDYTEKELKFAQKLNDETKKKFEELEMRASKAISEARTEASRLR